MILLVFEGLFWLLYFEMIMRRGRFHQLYAALRRYTVHPAASAPPDLTVLSHAMDIACAVYFHRVLCLQRSAATSMLLRRHGIRADMVVGVRTLPFKSHAWVEVDGAVVNDRPYVGTMYSVFERC